MGAWPLTHVLIETFHMLHLHFHRLDAILLHALYALYDVVDTKFNLA